MDANLVRRIGFAVIAIPVALGIVWLGGIPLALLVAIVSVLGTRELFDLAGHQDIRPARILGYITAAAFAPLALAGLTDAGVRAFVFDAWPYAAALWLIGLLTWALLSRAPTGKPLATVAVSALGPLYAGALPAFLLSIRHGGFGNRSWAGTWLVFFPLVLTWICDTAAMFGGRAFGTTKLAPTISPGKTRAGAIAGLVGALVAAPIYNHFVLVPEGVGMRLWQSLVFAAVLAVVGQVGDLAESLFKREAGVKDSSHLIPGHGGILDRFDSLYFVLPVAAVLYRLFASS
ncbi:MAG: phosphatidate cytidylyltransferase [Gemmatimonadota bacterium]